MDEWLHTKDNIGLEIQSLERKLGSLHVEKMVESRLKWFVRICRSSNKESVIESSRL